MTWQGRQACRHTTASGCVPPRQGAGWPMSGCRRGVLIGKADRSQRPVLECWLVMAQLTRTARWHAWRSARSRRPRQACPRCVRAAMLPLHRLCGGRGAGFAVGSHTRCAFATYSTCSNHADGLWTDAPHNVCVPGPPACLWHHVLLTGRADRGGDLCERDDRRAARHGLRHGLPGTSYHLSLLAARPATSMVSSRSVDGSCLISSL